MATLTITDVDAVRSEGGLTPPSEAAGAATDRQIKTAIRAARRKMVEKVGEEVYSEVQGWDDATLTADEAKDTKYDRFLHAESCYAIAQIAYQGNVAQLAASGLIMSIEIGKARQSFASSEESEKIGKVWEVQGNRWLSPYLTASIDSVSQKPTSFTSRKGTFHVGAL